MYDKLCVSFDFYTFLLKIHARRGGGQGVRGKGKGTCVPWAGVTLLKLLDVLKQLANPHNEHLSSEVRDILGMFLSCTYFTYLLRSACSRFKYKPKFNLEFKIQIQTSMKIKYINLNWDEQ